MDRAVGGGGDVAVTTPGVAAEPWAGLRIGATLWLFWATERWAGLRIGATRWLFLAAERWVGLRIGATRWLFLAAERWVGLRIGVTLWLFLAVGRPPPGFHPQWVPPRRYPLAHTLTPCAGTPIVASSSTVLISRVSVVSRAARSFSSTRGSARPLSKAPAKRGPHTDVCWYSTADSSSRGTRSLDMERATKGKFWQVSRRVRSGSGAERARAEAC
eukprot:scaffold6017_cov96-Isochrysis_galbana.AAC.1